MITRRQGDKATVAGAPGRSWLVVLRSAGDAAWNFRNRRNALPCLLANGCSNQLDHSRIGSTPHVALHRRRAFERSLSPVLSCHRRPAAGFIRE